jgi:hypothetical protein
MLDVKAIRLLELAPDPRKPDRIRAVFGVDAGEIIDGKPIAHDLKMEFYTHVEPGMSAEDVHRALRGKLEAALGRLARICDTDDVQAVSTDRLTWWR